MEKIIISDLSLEAVTKNYNFHPIGIFIMLLLCLFGFIVTFYLSYAKFHKDLGHGNLIPFTSKAESLLI